MRSVYDSHTDDAGVHPSFVPHHHQGRTWNRIRRRHPGGVLLECESYGVSEWFVRDGQAMRVFWEKRRWRGGVPVRGVELEGHVITLRARPHNHGDGRKTTEPRSREVLHVFEYRHGIVPLDQAFPVFLALRYLLLCNNTSHYGTLSTRKVRHRPRPGSRLPNVGFG
jgi:hypothetical protein